ncbi:MAG: oligosaccharide flippase family protein [Bacteroidetes bacterium]|nr:oligosaccharide flippase family protein [Bacteroidota bacterium]
MQKKFFTNLIILLFLNILIKPFWILVIEPHVQNEVGNAAYGEYFALFNFSFLLNILLDFGITNFNNKNIAQNNHLLTKHFSGLFMLKLMLAVIYIIATIIIGFVIRYDVRLTKLLLILGFNQFLISLVLYLRSNLQALHLFKTDAVISVLDRILMIGIVSMMLWTNIFPGRMDVMDFVYAQTAGYFLTSVIAFFAVIRKTKAFRLKWDLPFSLMILKKSFPFAILVLLMTFYNRIDSVMLERMLPSGDKAKVEQLKILRDPSLKADTVQKQKRLALEKELEHTGPEQAGYYAKGFRLLDATNMIAYLFSVLLLPMFSRMIKFREPVEQLVKLSFTLLITVAVIVSVGCTFYRNEILEMLYGKDYMGSVAMIFPLLMNCFIAISTTYIFGSLLTANGNMRELNIMAFSGMIINVTLNFLFIKIFKFEALGTAISSLSTQTLTALAQVLIVQTKFRFRINYRLLTTLFVYLAGVFAIANFCHDFSSKHARGHGWLLEFVVMVGASLAWSFAIRLISLKGLFRIVKYG